MKIPVKWLILTGSILLLLLTVYLCLPTTLTRVVGYYLAQEGIHLEKLEIAYIRPWGAHINSLELILNKDRKESGQNIRITSRDIHLGYHSDNFQDKRLDAITIKELSISIISNKQEQAPSIIDSASFLPSRWMELIPVESVDIENLDIEWQQQDVENRKYHILASLGYKDDVIDSSIRLEDGVDDNTVNLSLLINEKDQLSIRVYPEQNNENEFVTIQAALSEKEQGLVLEGAAKVGVSDMLSKLSRFGIDKKGEVSSILNMLEIEDSIEIDFQATTQDVQAKANIQIYGKKVNSSIKFRHNFLTEKGEIVIELDPFEFSKQTRILSSMYSPWEYPFDVLSGKFSGGASISWATVERKKENITNRRKARQVDLKYRYRFKASELAGFYNEIYFSGLNAAGTLVDSDEAGFSLRTPDPVKVEIKQVDSGMPITSISFGLSLLPGNRSPENKSSDNIVVLHNIKGNALEGEIYSKEVKIDPSSDINNLIIYLKGISVKRLLEMQKQQGVEGTGVIDGFLPVMISSKGLSISDGVLAARKPGGIIKYRPDNPDAFSTLSDPNIKMVMEALDNFHYQGLKSDVTYSPEGKLILKLRMEGRNPDMSSRRPVNLNINIEQNILTLLKSLKLADDIGERIGEKMRK